jgi:hypothetical protein
MTFLGFFLAACFVCTTGLGLLLNRDNKGARKPPTSVVIPTTSS